MVTAAMKLKDTCSLEESWTTCPNTHILAISKDRKTVLVIELKRGQASDRVVGQIHRYMGYVKDEVLEKGQKLKGLIIGLKPDQGLKRALSMCPDIEFRRYKVDFKLLKDWEGWMDETPGD